MAYRFRLIFLLFLPFLSFNSFSAVSVSSNYRYASNQGNSDYIYSSSSDACTAFLDLIVSRSARSISIYASTDKICTLKSDRHSQIE